MLKPCQQKTVRKPPILHPLSQDLLEARLKVSTGAGNTTPQLRNLLASNLPQGLLWRLRHGLPKHLAAHRTPRQSRLPDIAEREGLMRRRRPEGCYGVAGIASGHVLHKGSRLFDAAPCAAKLERPSVAPGMMTSPRLKPVTEMAKGSRKPFAVSMWSLRPQRVISARVMSSSWSTMSIRRAASAEPSSVRPPCDEGEGDASTGGKAGRNQGFGFSWFLARGAHRSKASWLGRCTALCWSGRMYLPGILRSDQVDLQCLSMLVFFNRFWDLCKEICRSDFV